MTSIEFIAKMDKIYEKLYSINEGLSFVESKEFMRGWKDGLNEGIGNFLGKAVHGVKQFGQDVKKGVTGAYEKGKELAGKAWASVKDFANDVYTKVKNGINTAADWIVSTPGKIKQYLTNVYIQVADSLVSAYNSLKDKAGELKQAIVGIWDNITTSISEGVAKVKNYWAQQSEKAQEWYNTNKESIKQQAIEAKNSTVTWLQEAGNKTLEVLKQIGSGALNIAKGVGYVSVFLIFAPIVGLYVGAKKLGEKSEEFVSAGMNKVSEIYKKEVADYLAAANAPMKETRIMTFEKFLNR